jgi:phospholipid-binding lipoprotein MlaA
MKKIIILLFLAILSGCASSAKTTPPKYTLDDVSDKDTEHPIDIYDPMEKVNRTTFYFNAKFDKYIHIPLVNAYKFIMPDILEDRVTSFFDNLGEIDTFTNQILQLKIADSGSTLGRFVVNSTFGVLGMFDVASKFNITKYEEDFGQTLAYYGVTEGPYLIIPVLGPSNLRDATGMAVDTIPFSAIDPFNYDDAPENRLYYYSLNAIDRRKIINYRYHQTGTSFEYEYIRFLYTKKRWLDVQK